MVAIFAALQLSLLGAGRFLTAHNSPAHPPAGYTFRQMLVTYRAQGEIGSMSAFEPYPQPSNQWAPEQNPYPTPPPAYYDQEPQFRTVNKIVYVLLAFFLGGFGVHRFLRGQVGIGICMILFNWLTIGIWALVDFIIGCVKLSKYPGDDFIFTMSGDWIY